MALASRRGWLTPNPHSCPWGSPGSKWGAADREGDLYRSGKISLPPCLGFSTGAIVRSIADVLLSCWWNWRRPQLPPLTGPYAAKILTIHSHCFWTSRCEHFRNCGYATTGCCAGIACCCSDPVMTVASPGISHDVFHSAPFPFSLFPVCLHFVRQLAFREPLSPKPSPSRQSPRRTPLCPARWRPYSARSSRTMP